MNTYVKSFVHRGLIFGGLGPIVLGIVYAVLEKALPSFTLTGVQVCVAIISTYLLAFVQAGASVFNQVERWSVPKAALCHFATLYGAYTLCYLLNDWIPFKPEVLLAFTGIFTAGFAAIWLIVYVTVKLTSQKMNAHLPS